ncbi:hypothetical protein P0E66_13030 [Enterococcus faecalis]|uniref:hypothetical protein n=1 Tax=Enterococcus faecalis TaxID=1351 RepID=UPI001A97B150|nr:hypothetical protein [Enterococcus faecalis]MBO1137162.1 hypothetical protein [Enterococcus faecalis]MDN3202050.1 hypothetical protein [Enterococcus faecalis]
MNDITGKQLHDGDYVKLSRYSPYLYQYKEKAPFLKQITGKQQIKIELLQNRQTIAVVKVRRKEALKQL